MQSLLTLELKQRLASQAKQLLAGKAVPGELGEQILLLQLPEMDSYKRQEAERKIKEYQWYYFSSAGVFGTKFAPAALELIALLPHLTGNALVEVAAWLPGPQKCRPDNSSNYYTVTQVMKTSTLSITNGVDLLDNWVNNLVVADFLRDSEETREQAQKFYASALSRFGDVPAVTEVANLMQDHRFGKALEVLQLNEPVLATRQSKILSGEILPDFAVDYDIVGDGRGRRAFTESMWAVLPNSDVLHPGGDDTTATFGDLDSGAVVISHGYGNTRVEEWWAVHYLPKALTSAQRQAVGAIEAEFRKYFAGPATGWKLSELGTNRVEAVYNGRSDAEHEAYKAMCANLPIEVSKQDTGEANGTLEVYARVWRTSEDKAVQAQLDLVADLEEQIQSLGGNRQEEREAYDAAESAWLLRDQCDEGTAPIEDGTVFLVSRFEKISFKGEERKVYGPFYDWGSGSDVQLVLDPFSHASHELADDARDVLIRVRKRSNEQLHLFERSIRPKGGGSARYTKGYFVVPVLSPQDLDWKVVELEEQLAQARATLEQLRKIAKSAAVVETKASRKSQQKWEQMSNPASKSHDAPASVTQDGITLTYTLGDLLRQKNN